MNLAFLTKFGRRLLNEKELLWAQVISAKYLQNGEMNKGLVRKHGASNLWRGICMVAPILKQGIHKVVRSGNYTVLE